MADVEDTIIFHAITSDIDLESAVEAYLNEKKWATQAAAHKKAREAQIKDYMGMASSKVLSNGLKVSVSAPIIKNVFDSKAFKATNPDVFKAYMKTQTQSPRLTITIPKAGDE